MFLPFSSCQLNRFTIPLYGQIRIEILYTIHIAYGSVSVTVKKLSVKNRKKNGVASFLSDTVDVSHRIVTSQVRFYTRRIASRHSSREETKIDSELKSFLYVAYSLNPSGCNSNSTMSVIALRNAQQSKFWMMSMLKRDEFIFFTFCVPNRYCLPQLIKVQQPDRDKVSTQSMISSQLLSAHRHEVRCLHFAPSFTTSGGKQYLIFTTCTMSNTINLNQIRQDERRTGGS